METKLIVGLGNPGQQYALNRHNIGFMLLDSYAANRSAKNGMIKVNDQKIDVQYTLDSVILLKPQDFMNNSGRAVQAVKSKLGVLNKNILVLHDEVDFEFGHIKLKAHTKGTSHNGVKSCAIIGSDFNRLRFGVGRPDNEQTLHDYVLSNFVLGETKCFCELSHKVIEIIDYFILNGVNKSMSLFNKEP